MKLTRTPVVAAIIGLVGVGALAPVAFASPPSGFTPTVLVKADFNKTVDVHSDGVTFRTKHRTDVMVQKIVESPGGTSGWHHHPGIVIIAVESGSITVWNSHCHKTTYGPGLPNGAVAIESGDEPAQVTSTDGATTYTTFVAPNANPSVFRIEDEPPRCA